MTKRPTKKQTFQSYHDHILQKPTKRKSIPTKPTIACEDVLEHEVLSGCMSWLSKRRIIGDRNNVGKFDPRDTGELMQFGIVDGGDWIGLLPNGRHLEIECKRGRGGTLSVGQQKRRKKILMNNGVYLIVHSAEELELLMEKYLKG